MPNHDSFKAMYDVLEYGSGSAAVVAEDSNLFNAVIDALIVARGMPAGKEVVVHKHADGYPVVFHIETRDEGLFIRSDFDLTM